MHMYNVWSAIFTRDLFSHFSRAESNLWKLKPQNFLRPRRTNDVSSQHYCELPRGPNFNRSLSVSIHLTAIAEANLEIKDTGTVSAEADKWTGRWRQIAFILSLFNPGTKSWDYCCFWNNSGHVVQLVAIELPNMRVPESLTAKIKTVKIWNTNFGPFCENLFYQLYGIKSRHYWGTSSSHFHSSLLECCWRIRWCCHAELPLTTSCVWLTVWVNHPADHRCQP